MAIDLNTKTFLPLWKRDGETQGVFLIPAKEEADKPGILVFGNVDGSGTRGNGVCLWADNTGALRYHTSIPTDEDSDGTAIGSGSGANAALSNLSSVAINTSLISDTKNTDDLGSAALYWKDLYVGGDIYVQEAGAGSKDVKLSFTAPTDDYTYTFPDAGANADVVLDTGGANALTITSGTASIALAAGNTDISLGAGANITVGAAGDVDFGTGAVAFNGTAAFDQATGTTVDINANLTVSGAAVVDQDLSASGAPTWTSLVTCQGIVNTATAIDTTAAIQIGADNVKLTFGASDATDSWIHFDGAGNMMLYDSNLGTARSLTELYTGTTLNPSVSGNFTITDGNNTWTNTANDETAVWTLAATTVDGIQIASSNTDSDVIQITANATTSGNLISLNSVDATMTSGAYLYCYDGAAEDFAIRRYGATTIAGSAAGTDALTLTAGDIKVTSGYLDLDSPAGNNGHNFATSDDGTSNTPFITITNSNVSFDQAMVLLDSNATGAIDAMQITHDSTGYGLSIVGTAATGKQLLLQGPASQTTAMAVLDGATGSWIGAADVGMLDISSDGALDGANLLRVDSSGANAAASYVAEIISSGNLAAAVDGACLKIEETGAAQATSYAVNISSTSNEALHVDAGVSLFDERISITLADNTGPALIITNPDVTGDTNAVEINPSGAGMGLYVNAQETDTIGVFCTPKISSTVSAIGTFGTWVGAASTGQLSTSSNGALADVTATCLRSAYSGDAAGASQLGSCARFEDTGAASGTSYAVYISTTNNEALKVDSGTVVVDETVTASGGFINQVATTDVADPPTQANMVTAFGAAGSPGRMGIIDDAGGGANIWLCVEDGTNWFYAAKLTVGA